MATGFEHRRPRRFVQPRSHSSSRAATTACHRCRRRRVRRTEVYVEFNVPLLADHRWRAARLQRRGRYYSLLLNVRREFTPKFGLAWQLTENSYAATFAEGFRAPSIAAVRFGGTRRPADRHPASFGLDGSPPSAARQTVRRWRSGGARRPTRNFVTTAQIRTATRNRGRFTAGSCVFPIARRKPRGRIVLISKSRITTTRSRAHPASMRRPAHLCVTTLSPQFCDGITLASTGACNASQSPHQSRRDRNQRLDLRRDLAFRTRLAASSSRGRTRGSPTTSRRAAAGCSPREVGVEVNDSAIP